jgi:hypothetical protein
VRTVDDRPAGVIGIDAAKNSYRIGISSGTAVTVDRYSPDISQVTYYLWRKKAGTSGSGRTVRTASARGLIGGMKGTIRAQVRSAIQAMLPQLIEDEVEAALGGAKPGGSRR